MIFQLVTGSLMPYSYLLTRMKSPTCSVGSIEPDGMRNGSKRKLRTKKTIAITGKRPAVYSSHQGWRISRA